MASNAPTLYVSSYTSGGVMKTMKANKVAEILEELHVALTDAEIELEDAQGNEKSASPSTVLHEGDTLLIMKKKNKSGN
jgi:glycerol dehydrogenase-like iron-containing ADH family enzyme